ncbi:MAG: hypothetical protein AB1894_15730 [Chloroflexota bacterium]
MTQPDADLITAYRTLLLDPLLFCQHGSGLKLRRYQERVAHAVVHSVVQGLGLSIVVMFCRQSGKNELQAQLETYLLTLLSPLNAEIVKVSPTWKPQSLNAMRRLERVLSGNVMSSQLKWEKEQGYIFRVGKARITFLSGSPTANIVGATAGTLLECDEAQDVSIEKWDKDINPMAASTNATRVFWGTAWTSQTLLARELRAALEAEKADNIQRVFIADADRVGREVPAYKRFVQAETAKLGRNHPFVRTQFYCEEIDSQGGMFPPERQALMKGDHPPLAAPQDGHTYAFLVDVGGEDKPPSPDGRGDGGEGEHDSTALTIVEIDLSLLNDPAIAAPRYLVRHRRAWTGAAQTALYSELRALAELWQPRRVVVDSTGIGAGLASFLDKAFPGQVIPFTFTLASKTALGWGFLAVIETGRFKDHASNAGAMHLEGALHLDHQRTFQQQLELCQLETLPGPGRMIRWGVPDGARHPITGELVHDDLLISAALSSLLDREEWGTAESAVVAAYDPLADLTF